jgi:hypothetical protein
MRVAVIRGDLSKPLFLADLEPKSTANFSAETSGQNRYLSRPDATKIAAYLASQSLAASASALITATVPVGGPVDVSSATITGVAGLGGATATQVTALQEFLAPRIIETDWAKKSFLMGNLAGYRSASFNPDPRRWPALVNGAAISVVADDGVTAYSLGVPTITTADKDTPGAGDLRITGTDLAAYGLYEVAIILLGAGGRRLTQAQILTAGGTFSNTIINIPASVIPGVAVGSTTARVRVNDLLSNAVALT